MWEVVNGQKVLRNVCNGIYCVLELWEENKDEDFMLVKREPIIIEEDPIEKLAQEKLDSMTLEEKIGQMIILTTSDTSLSDTLKNTMQTIQPGGYILMGYNFTTYDQTKKFIADMQTLSDIPMIISTDQEGGQVQRLQSLDDGNPLFIPRMYDLGKTGDEELAYQVGKVMAQQLRSLGINVTYAPDVDIFSNKNNTVIGKRSFGHTAELVSRMAISLGKGLEDNDVIATYKHFPGHGDTAADSHNALPIIRKSYEELKKLELIPFENAIRNQAKIIMIGHLALPNITNDTIPASLSKKIITDLLKTDLGYQGLVITDALNMGALTNNYTEEQIYTMAIEAGVDLLLMPKNVENVVRYVKSNIGEERIDESVVKILTFKYKYLTQKQPLEKLYLNTKEQQEILNKIPVNS